MAARQKLNDIENEKSYSKALQLLAMDSLDDLRKAEKAFEKIRSYNDSEQMLAQCTTRINEIEEEQYQKAVSVVDKAESLTPIWGMDRSFSYGKSMIDPSAESSLSWLYRIW